MQYREHNIVHMLAIFTQLHLVRHFVKFKNTRAGTISHVECHNDWLL
jgi:hypothetical protein